MTALTQDCFRALADPTRREILSLLSRQDMTIAQVAGHFDMTRAAVKKHLTVLEQAGLIQTHAEGRERINSFAPQGLRPAVDWLGHFDAFWDDRLTALKSAIEQDQTDA
ncbi:ArsR/SmtB family transcription factor [Actibacterium ureilyticum]|uniref:ArsR/SmtB family transcription factor n=1 Tax=Actibacterium ureilyticum TaxID=1590614 RepID=UPI000BAAC603|nr:metalloregulator ArsR/SmtB family transcription factor [Actibacterium ureilyticum]